MTRCGVPIKSNNRYYVAGTPCQGIGAFDGRCWQHSDQFRVVDSRGTRALCAIIRGIRGPDPIEQARRLPDADLLLLRNFGAGSLRWFREHYPPAPAHPPMSATPWWLT